MCISFTELDSEPANFDLVICASCTLNVAILSTTSKVSRTIQSISWAFPEFSPGLLVTSLFGQFLVSLNPEVRIFKEETWYEFLAIELIGAQIASASPPALR
ncbi:hypothetical protein ABVK25_005050 [Lepraria finkii]|uniref:Uncharacterized protein n=1 Tax=Lepraria finkii TaxID=1340010 RepID=A0ABR4BA47_9LECA